MSISESSAFLVLFPGGSMSGNRQSIMVVSESVFPFVGPVLLPRPRLALAGPLAFGILMEFPEKLAKERIGSLIEEDEEK